MTKTDFPNVRCQFCKNPVEPGTDSMWIDRREFTRVAEEAQQWEEAHPRDAEGGRTLDLEQLFAYPESAKWSISHVACYPDNAMPYDLDFPGTYRGLVRHVAHVMNKEWCKHTDLDTFLHEAADRRGRFAPR